MNSKNIQKSDIPPMEHDTMLAPIVMSNYEKTYNLILLGIVDYNGHKTILNEAINWAKHWIEMANEIEERNRNGQWLNNDFNYFFQAREYFEKLLCVVQH